MLHRLMSRVMLAVVLPAVLIVMTGCEERLAEAMAPGRQPNASAVEYGRQIRAFDMPGIPNSPPHWIECLS